MTGIRADLVDQAESFGQAWNRFWFRPSDPCLVSLLRILTGISVLAYVHSHSADLEVWFGANGLLPIKTVRQLTGGNAAAAAMDFRWSYFYWLDTSLGLWIAHLGGLLVAVAMIVGCCSRISCLAALCVVLSYVHRAPMITGQWEPVLTMMLLYLCVAPCGACYSWDAWWRRRRNTAEGLGCEPSLAATISVRLIQVHLSAFYLMMGLTKLAGATWWSGDAVWWLAARTESRLIDWTFLHDYMLLVNLWTHAVVFFELGFGILIWVRGTRSFLLPVAVMMWTSLALLSGLIGFCVLMLFASLSFAPPSLVRSTVAAWFSSPSKPQPAAAA